MSSDSVHTRLMRSMGSSQGWYDPIPPDQYMCFLDAGAQLSQRGQRALAWLRSKTIRAKRGGRTAYAKDDRGELALKQLASDLGWALSNASTAWEELEVLGLARRDGKRLALCAKVEKQEGRIKSETGDEVICTYNLPEALLSFFQQLPQNRRSQCVESYSRVRDFRKRLEAEAIAAARETGQELEDRFLAAIGYEHDEPRGRPKTERPPAAIQVSLLEVPDFFVQNTEPEGVPNSVQGANGPSYENGNGGVQKPASLLSTDRQKQVSEYAPQPAATVAIPPPPTHSKILSKKAKSEEEVNEVVETIEALTDKRLGANDPLRGEILTLVATYGVDVVHGYLVAKSDEKRRQRYRIQNAGALIDWAKQDLPLRKNRASAPAAARAQPEAPEATIARLESLLAEYPNHLQAAEWRGVIETLRKQERRAAHAGSSQ